MTQLPARRRSRSVKLVLVGVAGTAATLAGGCSSGGVSYQRNVYRTLEDCIRDYSLAVCQSKGYKLGGEYVGPTYRLVRGSPQSCRSEDPGDGRFHSNRVSTMVERSGFGVSCSRRSSSSRSSGRSSFWGG
jgi:uncharacterized protein YgiB involved in biofilm formation